MAKKRKKKRVWKIKNIMIFLGIILIIVGLIYCGMVSPVKNIYISGNQIVSDQEILSLSTLDEYPSFLLTRSSMIRSKIKENPYIEEVSVQKKFGNVIEISIQEQRAVADIGGMILLSNGELLENTYNLTDVPILKNILENEEILKEFTKKFGMVDWNILRQISEIEYQPIEVDEERFLLYMNDGNLVYITLTKIHKLNKYNQIKDQLGNQQGIIYLDSGDYVELKKAS